MEAFERRALLETEPNPVAHRDYVVTLQGRVGGIDVELRYVPDRDIVTRPALTRYLGHMAELDWQGIEHLGVTLTEDFFDVSIARWVEVLLRSEDEDGSRHEFLAEERQPAWNNTRLLDRIGKSG
jgi:hypothetical protein